MPKKYIKQPFRTAAKLIERMEEYAADCAKKKRFANISGFARFCKISKDELMSYQSIYRKEFKMIQDILEDEALQSDNKIAAVYLKAQYGYSEKPEKKEKNNIDEIFNAIDKLPSAKRKAAYEEISGASTSEIEKIIKKYEVYAN